MKYIHIYHVFADGQWDVPAQEHFDALHRYGLYEQLDELYIGFVGSEDNVAAAERKISETITFTTVNRSLDGWEQETMRLIPSLIDNVDGYVFYAHTKGAWHISAFNDAWRRSMTYFNVVKWQDAVSCLNNYDAYGCHICHAEDTGDNYYGGTFWWATTDYLKTLPPVAEEHRWGAEGWIGTNKAVRQYDANPGWPNESIFRTKWESE